MQDVNEQIRAFSSFLLCHTGYRLHSTQKVSPFIVIFFWGGEITYYRQYQLTGVIQTTFLKLITSNSIQCQWISVLPQIKRACQYCIYIFNFPFFWGGHFYYLFTCIFQFHLANKCCSMFACSVIWINFNNTH